MINKINANLSVMKRPIRSSLDNKISKLKNLNGSSMSGWDPPRYEPTEMAIPNGLDFKEKAYYLLTGNLPKSVFKRWFRVTDDKLPKEGDQVVSVYIGEGKYIGGIIEKPHDYISNSEIISKEHVTESLNLHEDNMVSILTGSHSTLSNSAVTEHDDTSVISDVFHHITDIFHNS